MKVKKNTSVDKEDKRFETFEVMKRIARDMKDV